MEPRTWTERRELAHALPPWPSAAAPLVHPEFLLSLLFSVCGKGRLGGGVRTGEQADEMEQNGGSPSTNASGMVTNWAKVTSLLGGDGKEGAFWEHLARQCQQDICQPRSYSFHPLGVLGYTGKLGLTFPNVPASSTSEPHPSSYISCEVISKAPLIPYGCFCSKKREQNQMWWPST